MTDDEAFIRRIVDSPGDDLPRLVYADWLDERSDPRGAYLRAELEALAADDIGGLTALRLTAVNVAGLDPVWVARVSRPPAGVCCAHLSLTSTGVAAQPAELDAAEVSLGLGLPTQFRALMLNYNLGRLKGERPLMLRWEGLSNLVVDAFVYLIEPNLPEWVVRMELVHLTEWSRNAFSLDHGFLCLATMFDEAIYVVSGRGQDLGSVHLTTRHRMYRVADSIGDFLVMLQPRT